uniref:PHD-type domain-containing protein n=1 Tax=Amphimedon queenslandica TaxID=400682 RepID=A0A1X7SP42_AMPQE
MITAFVRHSQRLSTPPAKPWVAVKQNGTVVCAHCSCMAGLGEACSHIAALLFTLEANTKMIQNTTCTSLPCSWLPPAFQDVSYAKLSNIDFSNPQSKKIKLESPPTNKKTVTVPTEKQLATLFQELSKAGKPAVLSIIPHYTHLFVPLCIRGIIPKPLSYLYNKECLNFTYIQLLNHCDTVFRNYSITAEMAQNVEKQTRGQSHSRIWFQQRAGRVTASKLKAAVCTSNSQPSTSLIKSICYPESHCFRSISTSWGCEHETSAIAEYKLKEGSRHIDFVTSNSGLVIHPSYPFMGASPDSYVECKCCGKGVVEVKCPYSCKEKLLNERVAEGSFFLKDDGESLFLDIYHSYYFQVQAQIKFSCVSYCDFVVWTNKSLFIQRVYPDEPFISTVLEVANSFVKVGILPEIIGKHYSKIPVITSTLCEPVQDNEMSDQDRLWCYCQEPEDEREMICCDEHTCRIQWFHVSCLHIRQIPKGKWYCPDCRRLKTRLNTTSK